VKKNKAESVEAMHKIKEQAILMKELLLKGELNRMGEILNFGWQQKQKMAEGIVNQELLDIYNAAMKAGSSGGKISGAGGGGFMLFYCPKNTHHKVINALQPFRGKVESFEFTKNGLKTWKINA